MFCFHPLIQFSPVIFLIVTMSTNMAAILLETGLHSSSIREFLEKVMNSLTVTKRLILSKFTQMAVIKMCFFSLIDRINFWDFGGHADYDEIRVELYGQTQVRVKLMSRKKIYTIVT